MRNTIGFIHDRPGCARRHGNGAEISEMKGLSTKSCYLNALGTVQELWASRKGTEFVWPLATS